MQQGQDYRRFGYQPLQGNGANLSAQKPGGNSAQHDYFELQRNSGGFMSRLTNSPLLSTVGILAAGGVFAFALYSFYPSSGDEMEAVPVIKAEATPIKIEPVQTGGMEIPFQDSTIYDSMRRADAGRAVRIENLLEPAAGNEEPMSREELAAKVEEQSAPSLNLTEDIPQPASFEKTEEKVAAVPEEELEAVSEAEIASSEPVVVPETEAKQIRNILEEEGNEVVAKVDTEAAASASAQTMHEPAASPETLAFVRSVLDKKDIDKAMKSPETNKVGAVTTTTPSEASAPEKVEPAAGVEGNIVTKGSHYVQLASITDRSKANAEWSKFKEQFSAIPGASGFRVQEANLDKGTFFRIQAGPYSEAQAKSICESIKTQKPGGCFVVQ